LTCARAATGSGRRDLLEAIFCGTGAAILCLPAILQLHRPGAGIGAQGVNLRTGIAAEDCERLVEVEPPKYVTDPNRVSGHQDS